MDDDDDALDMTPDETAFWNDLILAMRRQIVASLLVGNDAQCFTTEQYAAAYRKKWPPPEGMEGVPGLRRETAGMHLRTLGTLVEAEPGVWRPKARGE